MWGEAPPQHPATNYPAFDPCTLRGRVGTPLPCCTQPPKSFRVAPSVAKPLRQRRGQAISQLASHVSRERSSFFRAKPGYPSSGVHSREQLRFARPYSHFVTPDQVLAGLARSQRVRGWRLIRRKPRLLSDNSLLTNREQTARQALRSRRQLSGGGSYRPIADRPRAACGLCPRSALFCRAEERFLLGPSLFCPDLRSLRAFAVGA